jgi:hypothetical protein
MGPIAVALIVVVAIVAVIGLVLWLMPRRKESGRVALDGPQLRSDARWDEFAGLSESARCDLVFAVAALDGDRSHPILEHALGDPSEAVALAAAHALTSQRQTDTVQRYLARHPGERAQRIAQALDLLALD